MRFTEVNLFGVYVAPISVIMVAVWFVTIRLRWGAARFGLLLYVWHPALFVFAVYMIGRCGTPIWERPGRATARYALMS